MSNQEISQSVLQSLTEKLSKGNLTTFSERATVATFALNLDVMLARRFAAQLNDIVAMLRNENFDLDSAQVIVSVEKLAKFISVLADPTQDDAHGRTEFLWQEFEASLNPPTWKGGGLITAKRIDNWAKRVYMSSDLEDMLAVLLPELKAHRAEFQESNPTEAI